MRALLLVSFAVYVSCFAIPSTYADAGASPELAAGLYHTCLLRNEKVHCWGDNTFGQTRVPELKQPTVIAAGGNLSCALDQQKAICWGESDQQLTAPPLVNPTQIQVSYRGDSVCALDQGELVCWGVIPEKLFHQDTLGLGSVSDFSIGKYVMCSITGDHVTCVRFAEETSLTPLQQPIVLPKKLTLVKPEKVVVGDTEVCARGAYKMECWNMYWSSGTPFTPIKGILLGVDVNTFGCGITAQGHLTCWHETGIHGSLPGAKTLATGAHHVCLASDEKVACWGNNEQGQLEHSPAPEQAPETLTIHIEPAQYEDRLNITFPDARGTSLWKNIKNYGNASPTFERLPDSDQTLMLFNLADTGCIVEYKIKPEVEDTARTKIYQSDTAPDSDCSNPPDNFYVNDISKAIDVTRKNDDILITVNDKQTLNTYLNENGELYLPLPQITQSTRFIVFTPQGNTRSILNYAPEFLLLDLQEKKSYRIAMLHTATRPQILAYQNYFIFSFSTNGETPFGRLSLFNPETLIMRPIEGWQGNACGEPAITLIRDRLHSVTDSYMACNGGIPQTHQGKMITPYEIDLVYSDHSKNDSKSPGSFIQEVFDPDSFLNPYGTRQKTGRYFYSFENNQAKLVPISGRYQWPIPLAWQSAGQPVTEENTIGNFDAWFDYGIMHLQLSVNKHAEIDSFRLTLELAMMDAADTSQTRHTPKSVNWQLGFTLSGNPLQVSLDNKEVLVNAGLDTGTLDILESEVLHILSEKATENEIQYHFTFNTGKFPLRSIHGGAAWQLQLFSSKKPGDIATPDNTHITVKDGWHIFYPLSDKLKTDWGDEVLPRSIARDSFTHALKIQEQLYLFSPDEQRFSPYTTSDPDEQWLSQHSLHKLSAADVQGLVSSHKLKEVFYTLDDDQVRILVLFYLEGHPGSDNILVIDYDKDGNVLRSSDTYRYFEHCYRYCDDESPDTSSFSAWQLDTEQIVLFTGNAYLIFDPKIYQWVSVEGNLSDFIHIFSEENTDKDTPDDIPAIESYQFSDATLNIYSTSAVGEHQIHLKSQTFIEPLTSIHFKDPSLANCVSQAMTHIILFKPDATLKDIKTLDCELLVRQLEGIEKMNQLTTLSLYPDKAVSLQLLEHLPDLKHLTLQGEALDVSAISGKSLEYLALTSEELNLAPLADSHIQHLSIKSRNLALPDISNIKLLKKLDLNDSTLAAMTDEQLVRINFPHTEELLHQHHSAIFLLKHFPVLKKAQLHSVVSEDCPASPYIESLELRFGRKPLHTACYPNLSELIDNTADSYQECKSVFIGDGFHKLTRIKLPCLSAEIARQLPVISHLTVNYLDTAIDQQVRVLNVKNSCPDDTRLAAADNLTVTCTLHQGKKSRDYPSTITGEFLLTKAADGNLQPVNVKLKASLHGDHHLDQLFTINRGYRAITLSKVESFDVENSGRTPIWDLLPEMASLKNLRINHRGDTEPDFVFRLPKLALLENFDISGFNRLDISGITPSALKTLKIKALKDPFIQPLHWKNFLNLKHLQLPDSYPVAPSTLPCKLEQLDAFLKIETPEEAEMCSRPREVIFSGAFSGPAGLAFQQQLKGTTKKNSNSKDYFSVLWNEFDRQEFLKARQFSDEQLATADKFLQSDNNEFPLAQGGMLRAKWYIQKFTGLTD